MAELTLTWVWDTPYWWKLGFVCKCYTNQSKPIFGVEKEWIPKGMEQPNFKSDVEQLQLTYSLP